MGRSTSGPFLARPDSVPWRPRPGQHFSIASVTPENRPPDRARSRRVPRRSTSETPGSRRPTPTPSPPAPGPSSSTRTSRRSPPARSKRFRTPRLRARGATGFPPLSEDHSGRAASGDRAVASHRRSAGRMVSRPSVSSLTRRDRSSRCSTAPSAEAAVASPFRAATRLASVTTNPVRFRTSSTFTRASNHSQSRAWYCHATHGRASASRVSRAVERSAASSTTGRALASGAG